VPTPAEKAAFPIALQIGDKHFVKYVTLLVPLIHSRYTRETVLKHFFRFFAPIKFNNKNKCINYQSNKTNDLKRLPFADRTILPGSSRIVKTSTLLPISIQLFTIFVTYNCIFCAGRQVKIRT